jgi:hypothetical protein
MIMKKTYTKPEIEVSKFDVETVITADASANLQASIYTEGTGANDKTVVKVVDYAKIFPVK